MSFDFAVFLWALTSRVFFEAALITVALAFLSHLSAIVISLPLALGLDSNSKAIRVAIRIYVGVFRAIPTLLWLLFFWNALPQFSSVFREGWYTPFVAAWVALTINEAAYQVEINRAALNSVEKGPDFRRNCLRLHAAANLPAHHAAAGRARRPAAHGQ